MEIKVAVLIVGAILFGVFFVFGVALIHKFMDRRDRLNRADAAAIVAIALVLGGYLWVAAQIL